VLRCSPLHRPTDWVDGGWAIDQSVELSRQIRDLGVDLIDCSTGRAVPNAAIPTGPGCQVRFAEQIRKATGILTGAVGIITDPHQAKQIIESGSADAVLMARELHRQPHWPLLAAAELGAAIEWPVQYAEERRVERVRAVGASD
jgi:2,4-dienoyl-CoA reductase-like NADH-dependent reductase (Old Yellow Enzyme family)